MSIDNLIQNGSFCAIPWVSLMVNTNSQIRFCCIASGQGASLLNENQKPHTVGNSSLQEVWTSSSMTAIRQAMIRGDKIPACSNCYHQESINKESYRQMMTREWVNKIGKDQFNKIIEDSISSDHKNLPPIVYLDLRLGNLCNLKCRMCSAFNSSQIAKEHFDLLEIKEYEELWGKYWGKTPNYLKEEQKWAESNFLWDELISMIPNLKKVYMTGGEPTMIANNFKFMQECIAAGMSDKIELFFNTNCTNVTEKFLAQLSKFKTVFINASIDGTGKTNDYIRYPSNWEKISANAEKLAALPNVIMNITPVVQVYNSLDLINLLRFADSLSEKYNKDVGVDFLINRHPNYFDVTILPTNFRQPIAESLEQYRDISNRYTENYLIKNSVDGIINLMKNSQHENAGVLIKEFFTITKIYDSKRDQVFSETFPEISRSLSNVS
jgi:MoaA/NifB/PqqE/SkfB family radical SAM enzyme